MINAKVQINNYSETIIIHTVTLYNTLNSPGIQITYATSPKCINKAGFYVEVIKDNPFTFTIDNKKYIVDNNKSLLLLYNKLNTELTLNNI